MSNDIKRIQELVKILNEARDSYYNKSVSIMTDKEYDALFDELATLEKTNETVLSNSPTITVGYEVKSNLEKFKHNHKLLSLDKTKDENVLAEFLKKQQGLISWKLDGLTVAITYEDGKLIHAVTRGNGEIGEVITHNAKVFANLPLTIDYKGHLEIRGEAVISYETFNKINANLSSDEQYKNPRNLVSGSVRQLDSKIAKERNIEFIAFELVDCNESFTTKSNQLQWLDSLGFTVVNHYITASDIMYKHIDDFRREVKSFKYPTDGLVLTYNDIAYSTSLDSTSHHPKHSLAFKWQDETAETTLRNIEWQTSRTGQITPVAVFDPVDLEGTTVTKASVHNISILRNLELGLGDTITVYKANMIIPQIDDNLTRTNNVIIPKTCPVCQGITELVNTGSADFLYCTNDECSAKLIKKFEHYCSRDAMNIVGLSESTLEKFVEKGFIKEFGDIYELASWKKEIIAMDGFGLSSYNKLIKSIEKSKTVELPNFIYALGIDGVGLSTAKLICKSFYYDLQAIVYAKLSDLTDIDGIGDVTARSIFNYFDNETWNVLELVENYLNIQLPQVSSSASTLEGKVFVVTGSVEHFKNRNELVKKIEELGGKSADSVSKNTSYLINNDINSSSSKNKKAKELNVPIITELQFLEMIGEN